MAAEVSVVSLTTEGQAVAVLRQILSGEIDPSSIQLDFREADWLQSRLKLKGELYHQSLNSSAMRGLIEFQNSLFRSVSLLLHDSAKVTSLTDEEKSNFELIFRVSEGRSDVIADVKQSFIDLGAKLACKLICIAIISIAVGYFGVEGYKAYLGNTVDLKKVETDAQKNTLEKERQEDLTRLTEAVLKRSGETEKTLSEAAKAYDKVDRIIEERNKAFEAIVKGAEKSDGIDLQGITIPNPVIEELIEALEVEGATSLWIQCFACWQSIVRQEVVSLFASCASVIT